MPRLPSAARQSGRVRHHPCLKSLSHANDKLPPTLTVPLRNLLNDDMSAFVPPVQPREMEVMIQGSAYHGVSVAEAGHHERDFLTAQRQDADKG
jgi:hypothetical protein